MTGTVDWQTLGWVITVIVAALGLAWRIQSAATRQITMVRDWATFQIDERDKRIAALEKSLQDHKLYAAEHFVTKDGLAVELEAVRKSIDRLADLLNQLLIAPKPGPNRSRQA